MMGRGESGNRGGGEGEARRVETTIMSMVLAIYRITKLKYARFGVTTLQI